MSQEDQATSRHIKVGRISGIHGVRGWVKVFSFTQPRENIINYSPWLLRIGGQWHPRKVISGRVHGKGVLAHLEGVDDRDLARTLIGVDIAILRSDMPELPAGEYYWSDLEGLSVTNQQGEPLGIVDYLFETGANDVIVVKGDRERLIPFVQGEYIKEIDLETGTMIVDWSKED